MAGKASRLRVLREPDAGPILRGAVLVLAISRLPSTASVKSQATPRGTVMVLRVRIRVVSRGWVTACPPDRTVMTTTRESAPDARTQPAID